VWIDNGRGDADNICDDNGDSRAHFQKHIGNKLLIIIIQ